MKYKIEKWNNHYYLYIKFWWWPFWDSVHTGISLYLPKPFTSLEEAEKYLDKYYIQESIIVKKGKI